jgi:hypothetical protein
VHGKTGYHPPILGTCGLGAGVLVASGFTGPGAGVAGAAARKDFKLTFPSPPCAAAALAPTTDSCRILRVSGKTSGKTGTGIAIAVAVECYHCIEAGIHG